jgi:hypothetical protein
MSNRKSAMISKQHVSNNLNNQVEETKGNDVGFFGAELPEFEIFYLSAPKLYANQRQEIY